MPCNLILVEIHTAASTWHNFCVMLSNKFTEVVYDMSHLVEKPTMWFPNRSDTNQAVQLQKQARSLKFWS